MALVTKLTSYCRVRYIAGGHVIEALDGNKRWVRTYPMMLYSTEADAVKAAKERYNIT